MPEQMQFITRSLEETQALGRRIGALLEPGTVIALTGDLGSGKTSFVQGLARGLEVPDDYYITSPTFTLINEYPGRHTLFHVDLYRISDPEELDQIGLYDILKGDGVVAIEWAERLQGELPSEVIEMGLTILDDDSRRIHFIAHGNKAVDLLKRLS